MIESTQPGFTPQELERLQRLRASVLAFQNMIAPLAADTRDNAYNQQFNQLRLEAQSLLKSADFDKKVAQAITEDVLAERSQRVLFPRLAGIGMFGVILALVGLGVNSIILEDPVVNGLACCISSGGILLLIGAFAVWSIVNARPRLSNLGDLYLRGEALRYQIDHTLSMAIPGFEQRPAVDIPQLPSAVELALDSLNKQAADWRQKLRELEEQRLLLRADAPMELRINIDFVQRELERVKHELDRLQGQLVSVAEPVESPASGQAVEHAPARARVIVPGGIRDTSVAVEPDVEMVERARSTTIDMPPVIDELEAEAMDIAQAEENLPAPDDVDKEL